MARASDLTNLASGLAALSICESLLLAMGDLKIISEKDAVDVISDAASAHRDASGTQEEMALHQEAANILDQILSGGNSVRRQSK